MNFTFSCDHCGKFGLTRAYSLCKTVEHLEEIDANTVETVTASADDVATYCEACGVDAALQKLAELGITPVACGADPEDEPCTKCGQHVVRQAEPHVAYTLTLDVAAGEASVDVEDVVIVSPVCGHCEPVGGVQ